VCVCVWGGVGVGEGVCVCEPGLRVVNRVDHGTTTTAHQVQGHTRRTDFSFSTLPLPSSLFSYSNDTPENFCWQRTYLKNKGKVQIRTRLFKTGFCFCSMTLFVGSCVQKLSFRRLEKAGD
jgi:hypothetical protein